MAFLAQVHWLHSLYSLENTAESCVSHVEEWLKGQLMICPPHVPVCPCRAQQEQT